MRNVAAIAGILFLAALAPAGADSGYQLKVIVPSSWIVWSSTFCSKTKTAYLCNGGGSLTLRDAIGTCTYAFSSSESQDVWSVSAPIQCRYEFQTNDVVKLSRSSHHG